MLTSGDQCGTVLTSVGLEPPGPLFLRAVRECSSVRCEDVPQCGARTFLSAVRANVLSAVRANVLSAARVKSVRAARVKSVRAARVKSDRARVSSLTEPACQV